MARRSTWKEFWEMNGTFIQKGLPGNKVEGFAHVHFHHSKVITLPVFMYLETRGGTLPDARRLPQYTDDKNYKR